jgi:hypothetical protein
LVSYLYCGLEFESDVSIPELPQSDSDYRLSGLKFRLESVQHPYIDCLWTHHWLSPNGEKFLSYCNQASDHWLRFSGLADFHISPDARAITCYPSPGTTEDTLRHLLLDQVLPRCLAQAGNLMLHASAVQHEQGLILFIGDSGAGKSTLAGNFHKAGSLALSDDCLWIKEDEEQVVAVPSYGGLRLWEDSLQFLFSAREKTASMAHYSSKKRVQLEDNALSGSALPILAVIVLSPAGAGLEVKLEKLPHREAFISILKQTFQLDLTDLDRMTRHAQTLGRIVPRLKSFRLSMPHDYSLLPLVRQKILEAVS